MMCALAKTASAPSAVAGPGTNPTANTRAIVSPNAKTAASAVTVSIAISGGITSSVAGPSPEPGTVAIGACAVLGIVAHAVSVCIYKRAATLGGPVTGGLRGPCGAVAQHIACALQPCGTCASPRAIYLGVIRGARLRIQATG